MRMLNPKNIAWQTHTVATSQDLGIIYVFGRILHALSRINVLHIRIMLRIHPERDNHFAIDRRIRLIASLAGSQIVFAVRASRIHRRQ